MRRAACFLAIALAVPRMAFCAVTCTPTMSNLAFGTVNPASAATATGSLSWTCDNDAFLQTAWVTMCLNIGAGGSVGGQTSPWRTMDGGSGNPLQFQIYKDGAHAQLWGSVLTPATSSPLQVQFQVPGALFGPGHYTSAGYQVHGSTSGGQAGVSPATYANTFAGMQAVITLAANTSLILGSYPASCGTTPASSFPFTASAVVSSTCTVTASTLDFGTPSGLLGTNVDATTSVLTTCTLGTPYQIGLDNGTHASGSARRMQKGGETIGYELYRDSGRSRRWGDTLNVDTVSGVGNGLAQGATVYGRVAPQPTPSPGTYTDTITVNVRY